MCNIKAFIKTHIYLISSVMGVILGIALGLYLNFVNRNPALILWTGIPGEAFRRCLDFTVIPLLAANIISTAATTSFTQYRKLAVYAMIYWLGMNLLGSVLGLCATHFLLMSRSDRGLSLSSVANFSRGDVSTDLNDIFADVLRNIFAPNIVTVWFQSTRTLISERYPDGTVRKTTTQVEGVDLLGILFYSLIIGIICYRNKDKTGVFVKLACAVTVLMTSILEIILAPIPLAIAMTSLIAGSLARIDNLTESLMSLGLFVSASILFNGALMLFIYPLILIIVLRSLTKVVQFYVLICPSLITGFSTLSSLAALPELFKFADQMNVNRVISRMFAPFQTSFNANASAGFIAAGCVFLSRVGLAPADQHPASPVQLVSIALLSSLNVMALPAVPSASIVGIYLTSTAISIPTDALPFLFAVEFINDRLRCLSNICSHGICFMILQNCASCNKNLPDVMKIAQSQIEDEIEVRADLPVASVDRESPDLADKTNRNHNNCNTGNEQIHYCICKGLQQ